MQYRDLNIFDNTTVPVPDEEQVRRQCVRWVEEGAEQYNILVIGARVKAIANPWLREYTAAVMHRVVYDLATNDDPWNECRISGPAMETIEDDLRRITKQARDEQIWEEGERTEVMLAGMRTMVKERMEKVEQQVAEEREKMRQENEGFKQELRAEMREIVREVVGEEMREMQSRLESTQAQEQQEWHWPIYTAKASDEDRKMFESYMTNLCANPKTTAAQVRSYIRAKAEAKIIERIKPLEREYEELEKLGVNFTLKTYQNATEK